MKTSHFVIFVENVRENGISAYCIAIPRSMYNQTRQDEWLRNISPSGRSTTWQDDQPRSIEPARPNIYGRHQSCRNRTLRKGTRQPFGNNFLHVVSAEEASPWCCCSVRVSGTHQWCSCWYFECLTCGQGIRPLTRYFWGRLLESVPSPCPPSIPRKPRG